MEQNILNIDIFMGEYVLFSAELKSYWSIGTDEWIVLDDHWICCEILHRCIEFLYQIWLESTTSSRRTCSSTDHFGIAKRSTTEEIITTKVVEIIFLSYRNIGTCYIQERWTSQWSHTRSTYSIFTHDRSIDIELIFESCYIPYSDLCSTIIAEYTSIEDIRSYYIGNTRIDIEISPISGFIFLYYYSEYIISSHIVHITGDIEIGSSHYESTFARDTRCECEGHIASSPLYLVDRARG